jgi:hypothetical protein
MIEIGQTGTGKTQGLYYILEGLIKNSPESTIVWIDTAKTSEILRLATFRPLNLLIPEGCEIIIHPAEYIDPETGETKTYKFDIKTTKILNYVDVWKSLDPNRINIISFNRFVRGHIPHSKIVSRVFRKLIDVAYDYEIPVPLDIFIDEFQFVCPARHMAKSPEHYSSGMDIIDSLFTMRSLKVRFITATQSWKVINVAARDSFPWMMIRRGAAFADGKLKRFNDLWERVQEGYCWIVYPSRDYSDNTINLPFYGDGEELGRVFYKGILKVSRPKKKTEPEETEPEETEPEETEPEEWEDEKLGY